MALYYPHSFLNTCHLLNGLRKHKESAFKLDKSRVPECRHLGDRYNTWGCDQGVIRGRCERLVAERCLDECKGRMEEGDA